MLTVHVCLIRVVRSMVCVVHWTSAVETHICIVILSCTNSNLYSPVLICSLLVHVGSKCIYMYIHIIPSTNLRGTPPIPYNKLLSPLMVIIINYWQYYTYSCSSYYKQHWLALVSRVFCLPGWLARTTPHFVLGLVTPSPLSLSPAIQGEMFTNKCQTTPPLIRLHVCHMHMYM